MHVFSIFMGKNAQIHFVLSPNMASSPSDACANHDVPYRVVLQNSHDWYWNEHIPVVQHSKRMLVRYYHPRIEDLAKKCGHKPPNDT